MKEPQLELSRFNHSGDQLSNSRVIYDLFAASLLLLCAAFDDHLEVTNYLLDFGQTDIHNLGITLGLYHRHLRSMRDSETFRDDMIDAWLQKEDQVLKRGLPTWKTLVKALKDRRVNHIGLAEKIENEKLQTATAI